MDLLALTIRDAAAALRRRDFSAMELVRACLDRIAATDSRLNGFVTVCAEESLAAAAEADRRFTEGDATPPLLGIPIAVKDIFVTRGVRTTCGSKILASFVPPYESTAVARVREAGAILIGKTNLDEFAMGSSTENSAFGPARNPWNTDRVAGGSSGGSAVAVAAGQCLGALGTDTGGSIRLPAGFCGTVGMKPTYGRVSRYGIIAYASSLDQVGPFAPTVADCALLLETVAGFDPLDSTSVNAPVPPYPTLLDQGVKGLRLGIPQEYFIEGMQPEVQDAVTAAVRELERLGARAESISLPHTEYAVASYYLIATAEASSNLARYDGVRYGHRATKPADLGDLYRRTRAEGFGPEVKRRILLGTYALSAGYYDAYYLKAQKVRTLIRQDFTRAFETCDAVVTPVAPTTAFGQGEKLADPLQMYLTDIFTLSVNLTGLPGLSLPCGFDRAGLPIGLQVIGRPLDEATVLRVGHAFEQATPWHHERPPC